MLSATMNKTLANILRILLGLGVVIAACWGHVLFERTLIPAWIPIGVAITLAMVTLPLYRKWSILTTTTRQVVNLICHLCCIGSIGYMLFLTGNYYLRNKEASKEPVTVTVNKHSETKEQRNRIGKHRYRTNHVQRFYIEVTFANGLTKTLYVSSSIYHATRQGRRTLYLEKGCFGFLVLPDIF